MKTEVKLITPAIAEDLLKKNTLNRSLKERLIRHYARQMSVGLWKEETGESIKLSFDNNILDGQHRLAALIKANVSLHFLIISELEKDIFTVLDTGVTRTAGDILHIAGVTQAHNHASCILKYLKFKQGSIAALDTSSNLKDYKLSKVEIYSAYINRKQFWEAVILMSDKWRTQFQRVMSLAEIGSLYAFFYDIDTEDAFKFMDLLCSGTGLELRNPVRLLREKLIFSKTNLKFKYTAVQKLALIFKGWNYYREGKLISVLRFSRDLDSFPVPK